MTEQTLTIPVTGHPLAVGRWGPATADRTLVLLHAGVCDRRSWSRTAELLGDLGTVIAYDRRGFGQSPVSSGPYRDVDDLWAVVDHLGVGSGPVWLVGSSMGGLLALDAALADPDRVAGVVLFAPAVSGGPEPDRLEPVTEALVTRLTAARRAGDQERLLELHNRLWLDGPAAERDRVGGPARELALAMNRIILANDVQDASGAAAEPAWPRLEQIRTPATVAWGDLDLPEIIAVCAELADRLPQARRRVLPGTAHLPYLEQPEAVARVIREAVS